MSSVFYIKFGFDYFLWDKREQHGEILAKLAEILDTGRLTPIVDEQHFDLEEVGKAHDRLASGQTMGKVVISV